MGRLQWIAPASLSEVARDRIISFLLMSSTSWEGGEGRPSLCSSFPLFPRHLMAAAAAASLRVTYLYCIRGK